MKAQLGCGDNHRGTNFFRLCWHRERFKKSDYLNGESGQIKQTLAPVSAEAWKEIKSAAKRLLNTHLSARKFVEVAGSKDWDYPAVPVGKLNDPGNQDKKKLYYESHNEKEVHLFLIESFTLQIHDPATLIMIE